VGEMKKEKAREISKTNFFCDHIIEQKRKLLKNVQKQQQK